MKCCAMEGGVVLYNHCVCVYAFGVFIVNEDTERIYTHNDYTIQLHPP